MDIAFRFNLRFGSGRPKRLAVVARLKLLAQVVKMIEDADRGIWVAHHGTALLLPVVEVLYFMADAKYVTAVTSRTSFKFEDSLDSLSKRLGDSFIRSHRKYLVRVSAVRSIVKIGISKYLEIPGVLDAIPVSRREEGAVKEVLKARSI